jgi:hypothetical protein
MVNAIAVTVLFKDPKKKEVKESVISEKVEKLEKAKSREREPDLRPGITRVQSLV